MKLGTEDRKKLTILGVAGTGGLGAIFYIYPRPRLSSARWV